MPPAGPLIDAALRGMVLALMLLLAGLLLRERPRLAAAQAGVLLALGVVVQVLGSAPVVEAEASCRAQAPLVGVAVANAVLFFLFVRALFDDDFRWRPWHAAFWLFAFAVGLVNCGLHPGPAEGWSTEWRVFLRVLLRGLPLVGALLAVHAAVVHWREDLVEARRRLRVFVLATGVLYTLVQLSARLAAPQGRLSAAAALLDVAGLLVIAAGVSWQLLRLTATDLFPAPARQPPCSAGSPEPRAVPEAAVATAPERPTNDSAGPPDDRLAAALQSAMTDDRVYREEDLTVAALADRLAVPEYRLRRLINQRLGHRNFSAFVNGYRLDQARAALADPARREQPVLSIALEAGFGSIGPFNRAFKAATGRTPTEYRRSRLADS